MTTALAYMPGIAVPRIEFITACTPQSIDLYTDTQFYADLKKASKRLDAMAAEALNEHAEGKTRKFPA